MHKVVYLICKCHLLKSSSQTTQLKQEVYTLKSVEQKQEQGFKVLLVLALQWKKTLRDSITMATTDNPFDYQ